MGPISTAAEKGAGPVASARGWGSHLFKTALEEKSKVCGGINQGRRRGQFGKREGCFHWGEFASMRKKSFFVSKGEGALRWVQKRVSREEKGGAWSGRKNRGRAFSKKKGIEGG